MKILICPDKFKFTYNAKQISFLIKNILQKVNTSFEIISIPISDGGEGFLDFIETIKKVEKVNTKVNSPVFEIINSYFLLDNNNKTAYIELAKTSGLELLSEYKQNPLYTTTYGLGEQILIAKDYGAKNIIIGLGGSATNDAGIGMATALGYKFFDKKGQKIVPVGKNLMKIAKIENSDIKKEFENINIRGVTDVDNFLYGENGAAQIYAKQKGANNNEIELLDIGLQYFNSLVLKKDKINLNKIKGAGAAGGLGAGISYFLNGRLSSGSDYVLKYSNIEEYMKNSDLVITGEGKLDSQTLNGKIVYKISELAKKHNKKLIIICGYSELNKNQIERLGNPQIISIFDKKTPIFEAKKYSAQILEKKLEFFFN